MAAFFAATHPDRTEALWLDGPVHYAQDEDYPWGESEAEWETWVDTFCPTWGTDKNIVLQAHDYLGDSPENESLYDDPTFQRWLAKWSSLLGHAEQRRTARQDVARHRHPAGLAHDMRAHRCDHRPVGDPEESSRH